MPLSEATGKSRRGFLTPIACSMAVHLCLACPLVLFGARAVWKPLAEAVPVSVRLVAVDTAEARPTPAASTAGLATVPGRPGPVRLRSGPTSRPVPRFEATALPTAKEDVARAEPAVLFDRRLDAVESASPTGSSQECAAGVPAAGPPRAGQLGAAGRASAGSPVASWNPGEGPWVRLRHAIERHVTYPTVGRRMGWAGKVVVTFVLGADGKVEDVRVRDSSGHAVLDESAVQAVYRAVPLPHANEAVRILMPIEFSLR